MPGRTYYFTTEGLKEVEERRTTCSMPLIFMAILLVFGIVAMAKNSTYYECYEPMIHHRPPVNSSFNASSDSSDEGSPTNASSVFVNVNGSLGLYDKYPRQEFLDFDYVEEDRIMMESENNNVIDTTANSSGLNATSEENANKNGLRLVDTIGPHFDKNVTVSHVIPENQNAATFFVEDETDEDFESFYFEDTF